MKKRKISFNSPVVLTFAILCFAVTAIGILTSGKSTLALFCTYRSGLMHPLTYVRFFTHVLGHDGLSHFVANATYLLLLGPLLEEKYGSRRLIQVILLTAVITGIIHYAVSPVTVLCGASGVVFAFIVLSSFTSFQEGEIPLTFILVVLLFVGQQVYEGILIQDNVSQLAHVLGGAVGAVVGYGLNKKGGISRRQL